MTRRCGLVPWFFFLRYKYWYFLNYRFHFFTLLFRQLQPFYTSFWSRSEQIFYLDYLPSCYLFGIPSIEKCIVENLYLVIYLEYSADIMIVIFFSLCFFYHTFSLNMLTCRFSFRFSRIHPVQSYQINTYPKLQISCVTSNKWWSTQFASLLKPTLLHCPSYPIVSRDNFTFKERLFVKKGVLKQLKQFDMRGYLEVASAAAYRFISGTYIRLDWFSSTSPPVIGLFYSINRIGSRRTL